MVVWSWSPLWRCPRLSVTNSVTEIEMVDWGRSTLWRCPWLSVTNSLIGTDIVDWGQSTLWRCPWLSVANSLIGTEMVDWGWSPLWHYPSGISRVWRPLCPLPSNHTLQDPPPPPDCYNDISQWLRDTHFFMLIITNPSILIIDVALKPRPADTDRESPKGKIPRVDEIHTGRTCVPATRIK